MNKKKKSTYAKYLELTKEHLALRLIFAEDRIEKIVLRFNTIIQNFEEILKKNNEGQG